MKDNVEPKQKRPLIFERLHYRAPFGHVTLVAKFNLPIPEELLKSALSKAQVKYPLMESCIEQNQNGATHFVFDNTPEFKLTVAEKISADQWIHIMQEEQRKPFNLNKGPLIRFILLNSKKDADLIILCHHVICDGLSLTYLAKAIIAYLNNPNLPTRAKPAPPIVSEENLTVKALPGLLPKLMLKYYLNRNWRKTKIIFNQSDYEKIHQKYWQESTPHVTFLSLPKDLTAAFITRCQKEHVSVNSALSSALVLAQNAVEENKASFTSKVALAVNIRPLLKQSVDEAFGLLAGGNLVAVSRKKQDSFWGIAVKAHFETQKMRSSPKRVLVTLAYNLLEPTLIDAMWFATYGEFINKTAMKAKKILINRGDKPDRKLIVTNLGKINVEQQQKAHQIQTLFFIPPYWPNYEKIIGVVTAGGIINISILHDSAFISPERIEKFRLATLNQIEEAIQP